MRYIYNLPRGEKPDVIIFNDAEYELTDTNKMGSVLFMTYHRHGAEPILLVPTFAEQFLEAAQKFQKISHVSKPDAARTRLRALYGRIPNITEMEADDDTEYDYSVKYKDIEIFAVLLGGRFVLNPKFRIINKNVINSRAIIDVSGVPQLAQYCGTIE